MREKIESGAYTTTLPFPSVSSADVDVRKARIAYCNDEYRLEHEFKTDLEGEFRMGEFSQSVRDKVFDMAWERGHASGLAEVLNEYIDLMELLDLFRG